MPAIVRVRSVPYVWAGRVCPAIQQNDDIIGPPKEDAYDQTLNFL
jgi:hypothetical protein